MGADIHWVVERQLTCGEWVAVQSKSYFYSLTDIHWIHFSDYSETPHYKFGRRDYDWFGLLSHVRCQPIMDAEPFLHEGLPEDASDQAEFFRDDPDYHSAGHLTLAELRELPEKLAGHMLEDTNELQRLTKERLGYLEQIIEPSPDSIFVNRIIFGRTFDYTTGVSFPDVTGESQHHRLKRLQREETFKPIDGNTVRVIFAYDN